MLLATHRQQQASQQPTLAYGLCYLNNFPSAHTPQQHTCARQHKQAANINSRQTSTKNNSSNLNFFFFIFHFIKQHEKRS